MKITWSDFKGENRALQNMQAPYATPRRFCSKCQTETDRHADGKCKACAKARDAARYAANAEKSIASAVAWKVANPEQAKATKAAWAKANRDRLNAVRATRYAASSDMRAKKKVAYSAWQKANPEACRVNKQNRKAKKRANGGILSQGLSAKLFKLQRGQCACCSLPLGTNFHLDHIMPIALGGPNIDCNIQLLRQICNIQKKAKHPVDFMQSRGFLL